MKILSNLTDSIFKKVAYERPAKGIWYKIKDPQLKTVGNLLGTLHLPVTRFSSPDPKLARAFNKSRTVATEVNLACFLKSGWKPKEKELQNRSTEEILKAKHASRSIILDHMLELNAYLKKKKLVSLETPKQNLGSLSGEDQTKISDVFKNPDPKVKEFFQNCVKMWEQGNLAFFDEFKNDKKTKGELDLRDPKMADRIDQLLKEKKRLFVGMGTCHLPGVVPLLQKKGWRLERVEFIKRPLYKKVLRTFRSIASCLKLDFTLR
jgi:uncharacterized protein YbaP (TraB family)